MYYIYRITNKLNNKTYIGQHKYKDLSTDTYMGSGKLLWIAYNKYGIENFKKEILISNIETQDEINKLEIEYINLERKSGHGEYNISDGGHNPVLSGEDSPGYNKRWIHDSEGNYKRINKYDLLPSGYYEGFTKETLIKRSNSMKGKPSPMKGKTHSIYTRNKMSKSRKGIILSDEHKNNISKSMMGSNNSFYNKHHSEKSKRMMSESHKRENLSEETLEKMSKSHSGENGSMFGKHHSEEAKKRISNSQIGQKYYNNGIECHRYIPGTEPEGYVLGILRKSRKSRK